MTMPAELAPLQTPRLQLRPISAELACRILEGDLGGLRVAPGWPHDDTADGLRMAVQGGYPAGWLVLEAGAVIGDCGFHGPPRNGTIEIGYGLAAPSRGRGFGSELVQAVSDWLLSRPQVRQVSARTLPGNVASQRVLEKAGFERRGTVDGELFWERDR